MSIGIAFVVGVVVGTMGVIFQNEKEYKRVSQEAFDKGFCKGRAWKFRHVIEAERRLDKIQAEVEELKRAGY